MELLARTAGSPQVILLTDQDEVASWARLEALTGEVALVEPSISTQPRSARRPVPATSPSDARIPLRVAPSPGGARAR